MLFSVQRAKLSMTDKMIYDFYSFGGETREPLKVENFEKDRSHNMQIFNAKQVIRPLKEYQGSTALKEEYSNSYIDKLSIPSQDPRVTIVLDYHVFSSKTAYGNKVKPLQLLKTCSRWNEEFDAQIYICAYVKPLSDDHFKLLARFDDPAFQRVFEGLIVVPVKYRRNSSIWTDIQDEIPKDESTLFLHIDQNQAGESETMEDYIREQIENVKDIRKELKDK